jgi:kanamycin kinase
MVYALSRKNDRWFLKLGAKLQAERDRLDWLISRVPAPRVVGFETHEDRDALLTTAVAGRDLASVCGVWSGEEIAFRLADALRALHGASTEDCPFADDVDGPVLVHGDACLPNVLFHDNGDFSGFVDLGELRLGCLEVDLSAAVWSLQYNLGRGFGLPFLRRYGVQDADEETVEQMRLTYESRGD